MTIVNIGEERRTELSPAERAIALADDNVIPVAALRAAGVSMHVITRRCAAGGSWQRPFSRVVVTQPRPLSRRQFLRALLVQLGDGAVITGMDALCALGAAFDWPPGRVHVLVPANRRVSVDHRLVAIERTTRTPQALDVDGMAMAPPARACIDATRRERQAPRVRALLLTTIRDGLCAPEELRAELDRGSQRGAAAPRALLDSVVATVASLTERRAQHLVAALRLPSPRWHCELTDDAGELLTVVSAHWPEIDLSWDLSPTGHHTAILSRLERRVVHTAPAAVLGTPRSARSLLEKAYLDATLGDRLSDAE